jgi:signal transduction histidine kinase/DNA-binding response OmpR family regulator
MSDAQRQTIDEALAEEARPLVLRRLEKILTISLIGLILSAASDLRLAPDIPWDLVILKLGGGVAQGLCAITLHVVRASTWRTSMIVATISWIVACGSVSLNGYYMHDPLMPALLLPVMVIGAAMVFPWGLGCQIIMVFVSVAMMMPHAAALGTNIVVSLGSVCAASVYVAATFGRQQHLRKGIELLQAGQQRITEYVAADMPLKQVCAELLETIWQQQPQLMTGVVLLDRGEGRLRCVAAKGLPDGYRAALEQVDARKTTEWCEAVHTGVRAITSDIVEDPRWSEVRFLAVSHKLRSSWSEPIMSADHTVLGVLSVYRHVPHTPDERELHLIAGSARLLGIAIERYTARQQLDRYVRDLDGARLRAEAQTEQMQRQALQLVEARDQAVAAVRARSQFLANMSHEIRTPLNGIIGVTDMLLDSELTAAQQEQARILSQCGEHLLGVINDILDFSKIEAGKVTIERIDLDLRALIEDVGSVMAERAQIKGVELLTVIPPALDITVKGDPARLRQVLVNLVGNAIKFTEQGEVVIELKVHEESATRFGVRLAVRDTGIGIAPERQAAVFDSFTQADGSTTRNYGGTGLGLTITRELVHLMNGKIGLQSAPGHGSTFWIELSLDRAPALTLRRANPEKLNNLRVLVVDDNETNRMILDWSLQGWGCRVQEAADGREALKALAEAAATEPFGLVLLDMQMPDLDGVEIAQQLKATKGSAAAPVILLSSIGGLRGGDAEARVRGIAAVITKPVRQAALLEAMLAALGQTTAAAELRPKPPSVAATSAFGLRVLLAEDNRVNQLVARRILEKLGCTIDIVENGREAVDAVARSHYDVVLMDIQMPIMDGFEATTLIRQGEASSRRVPIIAMTAHAMQGDRERCLAVGMDGYVSKPVNIAGIANAIAELQGHSKVRGARTEPVAEAS